MSPREVIERLSSHRSIISLRFVTSNLLCSGRGIVTIRKCSNWLLTFRDWSLPRSEAPESYHLWTGLFTLASVFKRRVRVPKKILGGWDVAPTLFVIFVAPPGKARKSTTAGYSEDLLGEIPTVERVATSITKEQLLKKLSEVSDASLSIFSSEFAMFIQKSGFDMYDVLTHLFDANRDVSVETIGRGLDFAEKPCVNLLACTTPDWIAKNMPETVIGGGFASRVIFVFEEKVRRHKLYYEEGDVNWDLLSRQRDDLVEDLMHMATAIEGDFTITDEAKEFMGSEDVNKPGWYQKHAARDTSINYRLQGYYERKPAHVHKIAMLLHLAYSDELELNLQDFMGALEILDDLELKLPRTFENIGKNPFSVDLMRMLDFVRMKKEVSKREMMATFYQSADPRKLNELIQGLIDMGEVKLFVDPDDPHNISKQKLRYAGLARAASHHTD